MCSTIPSERATAIVREVQEHLLRTQIRDSTLHPIVWLLLSGLLVFAWVLQPVKTDASLSTVSLMFLRFVPVFIIFGSLWGRAGTGAIVGIGLFFGLMGVESLSVLTWEVDLSSHHARLFRHAAWVGDALYLLGLVGLLACGAATFILRREKKALSKRYVRRCLELLLIIQTVLVVDLTYTGFLMGNN
jgi:hypothetical protein